MKYNELRSLSSAELRELILQAIDSGNVGEAERLLAILSHKTTKKSYEAFRVVFKQRTAALIGEVVNTPPDSLELREGFEYTGSEEVIVIEEEDI
jgi:hypothetical protein